MKKIFLIACLIILCGCAAFKTAQSDYDACAADPACAQKIQETSNATTGIGTILGNAMDSPISIPVAVSLSMLASLAAGVYFGRKKRKT